MISAEECIRGISGATPNAFFTETLRRNNSKDVLRCMSEIVKNESAAGALSVHSDETMVKQIFSDMIQLGPAPSDVLQWIRSAVYYNSVNYNCNLDRFICAIRTIPGSTVVNAAKLMVGVPFLPAIESGHVLRVLLQLVRETGFTRFQCMMPLYIKLVQYMNTDIKNILDKHRLPPPSKCQVKTFVNAITYQFSNYKGTLSQADWVVTVCNWGSGGSVINQKLLGVLVAKHCTMLLLAIARRSISQRAFFGTANESDAYPNVFGEIVRAGLRGLHSTHRAVTDVLPMFKPTLTCNEEHCAVHDLILLSMKMPLTSGTFMSWVFRVFESLANDCDFNFMRHMHSGCPHSRNSDDKYSSAMYAVIAHSTAEAGDSSVLAILKKIAAPIRPCVVTFVGSNFVDYIVRVLTDRAMNKKKGGNVTEIFPGITFSMTDRVMRRVLQNLCDPDINSLDFSTGVNWSILWEFVLSHCKTLVPFLSIDFDNSAYRDYLLPSFLGQRIFRHIICKSITDVCDCHPYSSIVSMAHSPTSEQYTELLATLSDKFDMDAETIAAAIPYVMNQIYDLYYSPTLARSIKYQCFSILVRKPLGGYLFDSRLLYGLKSNAPHFLYSGNDRARARMILKCGTRIQRDTRHSLYSMSLPSELLLVLIEFSTCLVTSQNTD